MVFDKELSRLWLEKENSERNKTNLDVDRWLQSREKKIRKLKALKYSKFNNLI